VGTECGKKDGRKDNVGHRGGSEGGKIGSHSEPEKLAGVEKTFKRTRIVQTTQVLTRN